MFDVYRVIYYKANSIKSEGNYLDGYIRHGNFKFYNIDGRLFCTCEYRYDKKNGKCVFFNRVGNEIAYGYYNQNRLVSVKIMAPKITKKRSVLCNFFSFGFRCLYIIQGFLKIK